MRGVDTNVLVRFLVRDDPEQARKAAEFLMVECSAEDPGLVNHIVLCELVWVLGNFYAYERQAVARALSGILDAIQLNVPDREAVRMAITQFQAGADFPDALIGLVNLRLGCRDTVTFDRAAGRRAGFSLL
jgi:predicted nucleic-acid-binding protein